MYYNKFYLTKVKVILAIIILVAIVIAIFKNKIIGIIILFAIIVFLFIMLITYVFEYYSLKKIYLGHIKLKNIFLTKDGKLVKFTIIFKNVEVYYKNIKNIKKYVINDLTNKLSKIVSECSLEDIKKDFDWHSGRSIIFNLFYCKYKYNIIITDFYINDLELDTKYEKEFKLHSKDEQLVKIKIKFNISINKNNKKYFLNNLDKLLFTDMNKVISKYNITYIKTHESEIKQEIVDMIQNNNKYNVFGFEFSKFYY